MEIIYPKVVLSQYQIGLAVMVRNRPSYVKSCFNSLQKSDLSNTLVVILDDASEDIETIELVKNFVIPNVPVIKIFLSKHKEFNIHENLKLMWDLLSERYCCQYLCVLDSDMVVKPHWLQVICAVHKKGLEKYGDCIVSGFNSWQHRVKEHGRDHVVKHKFGGANMLLDVILYRRMVRDCLCRCWDDYVCTVADKTVPLLVACPSVCQHIGKHGLFSKGDSKFDFALDFSWRDYTRYYWIYLCVRYMRMPLLYFIKK